MSQTETIMVLVLGAVLTLICVLFFARLIWNMGQRLARRRAEKAKPALIRDLEADRDQLRASHAMMSQRLTSGLAEAKAKVVEQQAEVARHRNRILSMTQTINNQDNELHELQIEVRELTELKLAQSSDLEQRAELLADLRTAAEAREEDILMLKTELQKTAALLEESKTHLQRLELERNDAVRRHTIEREAHSLVVAQRDALERDRSVILQEREPPQPIQPGMVMVKPSGSTQAQRHGGFGPDDDGLTLPPVPLRPARSSDLAGLLQSARRTMMDPNQEQSKQDPSDKRSRSVANVVSLAQKIRGEREE
jgi:hypothetical protein